MHAHMARHKLFGHECTISNELFFCDKKINLNQENIYLIRAHEIFWCKFKTLFLISDFSINFQFLDIGKVRFSNESGSALIRKLKCKYW